MNNGDHSLEKLEKRIPERVAYALRSAYKVAINSGHFVVIARRGRIIRINPDLTMSVVGRIQGQIKVKKGSRVKLDDLKDSAAPHDCGTKRERQEQDKGNSE